MIVSSSGQASNADTRATRVRLAAAGLVLLTLAAYHNSFRTPFVFDDLPAIVENASIRRLWPLSDVLLPQQPGGVTVAGRPLVNLSLAFNHAASGDRVWSYHAVNFAIHACAGLCLFGIVRRTLRAPVLRARFGDAALLLAWAVAAVWLLHPLQTESVTYVVQRAESLAALFYLLTLYAFTRAVGVGRVGDPPSSAARGGSETRSTTWLSLSVLACLGAMASKETAVSAPLILLLYDRTFVSGTFREAWRRRARFYGALAATWLLLLALVISTAGRGGTAGFGTAISPWAYALTQCRAIVRYLALSVWPEPLVFDYGLATARGPAEVWPQAIVVLGLLAATVVALMRRPVLGFVGAWFFALLGPSSSFVPVATQTIAEHRMYLPLAAVVVLLVGAGYAWGGRRSLVFWSGAALALAFATALRNRDYASELVLWSDTAAKVPANARAHNNLGQALFRAGRPGESLMRYQRAIALQPDYPEPHFNLGVTHALQGRPEQAIGHYETALRLEPNYAEARVNLGNTLLKLGRPSDALREYERALAARPDLPEAHHNLGHALLEANRTREARPHLEAALRLKPDFAEAHYHLGNALAADRDMAKALEHYRRALALKPDYADAHVNAGNSLLELGRGAEARTHYERALALNPRLGIAQFNLGSLLMDLERWPDAIPRFEAVLRESPEHAPALRALGYALAKVGRRAEAIAAYERCLRAAPNDGEARAELAALRGAR